MSYLGEPGAPCPCSREYGPWPMDADGINDYDRALIAARRAVTDDERVHVVREFRDRTLSVSNALSVERAIEVMRRSCVDLQNCHATTWAYMLRVPTVSESGEIVIDVEDAQVYRTARDMLSYFTPELMRWEIHNIVTFVERSPDIAFTLITILHGGNLRPRYAARRIVEAMVQSCNALFRRVRGSSWSCEDGDECAAKLVLVSSSLFQALYHVTGRARKDIIERLKSTSRMDVVVNFLVEFHRPDFPTGDESAQYSCAVCDGAAAIGDDYDDASAEEGRDGVPVFCRCRMSRVVHRDCLYPKRGTATCSVCEEEVITERAILLFEDSRRLSDVSEIELYVALCDSLDRALDLAARNRGAQTVLV